MPLLPAHPKEAPMASGVMRLLVRHKAVLAYLFFGVCTTAVNVAVYALFEKAVGLPVAASTTIAWVVAVSFAFITNKMFVFKSKSWHKNVALREAASFFLCRIAIGVFDLVFMIVTVDLLCFSGTAMKLLSNVAVIVMNCVASKLVILKRR